MLDSVVPADGEEPLGVASFQAIGPVLAELCSQGTCKGITANPLADIAQLGAQLARRPLSGYAYDGSGRRHRTSLTEVGLLGILEAGDLNPAVRALLPAAVRSALTKDPYPLLRLSLLAQGLIPSTPETAAIAEAPSIDEALFATTACEETPFPWNRAAPAATRMQEALAALAAEPAGTFYPFNTNTALNFGLIPDCSHWPDASPAPPPTSALPNVPTLILSGAQDLRTPAANARHVAATIPDAQVVVVPFTGHSVLGSDLSGCAARAVASFFAGAAAQACPPTVDKYAPTPVTPTKLTSIHPPPGLSGRAGQTLVAVLDTIIDLNRQVIGATIQADQELPVGSSFGGLRGGYARLASSAVILRRYSFIPGVELTATFQVRHGELQPTTIHVSGGEAAQGTVRLGAPFQRVTGTLGGRQFSVNVATAKLSSASTAGHGWPTLATVLPRLHDREAQPRPRPGGLPQLP